MRPSSHLVPVVLAGFVAVLVGYASSAAIIWQAAAADERISAGCRAIAQSNQTLVVGF